ncbi:MAG: hypothetical protein RID07_04690, partial [Lacipirellulaceae bacterium]
MSTPNQHNAILRLATCLLSAHLCCLGCSATRPTPLALTERATATEVATADEIEDKNWPGGGERTAFQFPEDFSTRVEGTVSEPSAIAIASQRLPRVERIASANDRNPESWFPSIPRVEQAAHWANSSPLEQPIPTEADNNAEPLPLPESSLVSDTFIETDVREALQSLATQAGVRLIVDDQVRGTVSANIEERTFEESLVQVLHPLGFVFRNVGETVYVGVPDPDSALFPEIAERFRFSAYHRDPEELAKTLPKRYQKFVRISPQGGWLIVEAPEQQARHVLSELEELDQPVPQVVLEALICVYSPETNFRFGFNMESGVHVFGKSADVALNSLSIAGKFGAPAANSLNDFRVTSSLLKALEQKGYVKIRAAPRVMAQDGKQARIHIGRDTFFSVQPETNNFLYRQDVQQVSSGIMLDIVPRVREPNVVVDIERAEVSEDIRADETQAGSDDRFPLINRRSVST